MSRLAHSSIVLEILIELWLGNRAVVVPINVFVDGNSETLGVGLQDMGEMRCFGLGWNTSTDRAIAGQATGNVERGLDHPVCMVFFDARFDGALEPCLVVFGLAAVELIEDLQGEVREEGRLGAA